jgi:hypothetical protein
VLVRRSLAIAGGVIAVILLAVLVRGCLDARQERAYEGYVQEVSSLVAESGQESEALFQLLEDPGDLSAVDAQNNLNGFAVDGERLVERARSAEPPEELAEVHDRLVQTLELREQGLSGIAREIPTALGDEQREEAIASIAAQMRSFLASDVIYSQQVQPALEDAIEREELSDEVGNVPRSEFLPDPAWIQDDMVSEAVDRIRGAGSGAPGADDEAAGSSGTGLAGVTIAPSGQVLTEGSVTEVPAGEGLSFEVQVQNQGETDEQDVPVLVTLEGGDEPTELEGSLDTLAAGDTGTVSVPLDTAPVTGEELQASVEVEPLEGEEVTDNNVAEYGILLTEQ